MSRKSDHMNKVILVGRLAWEPELRSTQTGAAVVSFTVACDRRYRKEGEVQADFISCVAWNKTAEFIYQYFTKGMRIALDGSIQTRSWQDQNGNKRYTTEVLVDDVEFAQSKNESVGQTLASAYPEAQAQNDDLIGFVPIDDEDLPF